MTDWVATAAMNSADDPIRRVFTRLRAAADASQGPGTAAFAQFAAFHDLLASAPTEKWPNLLSESERRAEYDAMREEGISG